MKIIFRSTEMIIVIIKICHLESNTYLIFLYILCIFFDFASLLRDGMFATSVSCYIYFIIVSGNFLIVSKIRIRIYNRREKCENILISQKSRATKLKI